MYFKIHLTILDLQLGYKEIKCAFNAIQAVGEDLNSN